MLKKAQASMEFLMTYGWAILVVLAAIGALAYFGVLSPDKFVPESCKMAPGMDCSGFKAETAQVEIVLRNGMGKDIKITEVAIGNCTQTYATPEEFDNGDQKSFSVTCATGSSGDRFKEDIIITYNEKLSGITGKRHEGSIVAKIQ